MVRAAGGDLHAEVRGRLGKKLRAAFRAILDGSAEGGEHLRTLAAENPELAEAMQGKISAPDIPKVPAWAVIYTTAWSALKDDRSLGYGGAMTRIHYASISAYGRDIGVTGDDLRRLAFFVTQLDEEYLIFTREQLNKDRPNKP